MTSLMPPPFLATALRKRRKNVAGGSVWEPQMIQSSHPVWYHREEPTVWWVEAERSEAAGPEPTQPNWIQTNLATKRRDQTGWLD